MGKSLQRDTKAFFGSMTAARARAVCCFGPQMDLHSRPLVLRLP
jgi:hypothetical protein